MTAACTPPEVLASGLLLRYVQSCTTFMIKITAEIQVFLSCNQVRSRNLGWRSRNLGTRSRNLGSEFCRVQVAPL